MNYDVYVDECVLTEHPLHHMSCKTGKISFNYQHFNIHHYFWDYLLFITNYNDL